MPTNAVRKMRWTYAADLQAAAFVRSEFQVDVSNWTVTGLNRNYRVAGPGSRRIDDDDLGSIGYSGAWTISPPPGNFSGGTIRYSTKRGDSLACTYHVPQGHELFLGTRYADKGTTIQVSVDALAPQSINLRVPAEDVLARVSLGQLGAGDHTVHIANTALTANISILIFWKLRSRLSLCPHSLCRRGSH